MWMTKPSAAAARWASGSRSSPATYKRAFFEDLDTLRIKPAAHYPAATEDRYIAKMIEMIQQLEAGASPIRRRTDPSISASRSSPTMESWRT